MYQKYPVELNFRVGFQQLFNTVTAYLECSYLNSGTLDVRLVFGSPVFCSALRVTSQSPTTTLWGCIVVVGTLKQNRKLSTRAVQENDARGTKRKECRVGETRAIFYVKALSLRSSKCNISLLHFTVREEKNEIVVEGSGDDDEEEEG